MTIITFGSSSIAVRLLIINISPASVFISCAYRFITNSSFASAFFPVSVIALTRSSILTIVYTALLHYTLYKMASYTHRI